MKEYIVYRHGWNVANQNPAHGLPQKQAVLRLYANSPEEACELARPQVEVLDNQYLTAEPAADVDAKENQLNQKAGWTSTTP
jgi:hypothetical protein